MLGLENEAIAAIGTIIGAILISTAAAIKSAMVEKKRDSSHNELDDVRGEGRQLRQELRLEHKETRKRVEDEHRETRESLATVRDLLIEVRALLRNH